MVTMIILMTLGLQYNATNYKLIYFIEFYVLWCVGVICCSKYEISNLLHSHTRVIQHQQHMACVVLIVLCLFIG